MPIENKRFLFRLNQSETRFFPPMKTVETCINELKKVQTIVKKYKSTKISKEYRYAS